MHLHNLAAVLQLVMCLALHVSALNQVRPESAVVQALHVCPSISRHLASEQRLHNLVHVLQMTLVLQLIHPQDTESCTGIPACMLLMTCWRVCWRVCCSWWKGS